MSKFRTMVLAPVLALAFLVIGNPAAHAFGSEVLGCAFDNGAWYANSCTGPDADIVTVIHFSPHNLSGTYSYKWTITAPSGSTLTTKCSSNTLPCIAGGCTTTSTTCDVKTAPNARYEKTFWANLQLTQSGQTRSIRASAVVNANCPDLMC